MTAPQMNFPVLVMTSPHARWVRAGQDVVVEAADVSCALENVPFDTLAWLDRLRHGIVMAAAPASGSWLDVLIAEGLASALPARDATLRAVPATCNTSMDPACDFVHAFETICDGWIEGVFASPFWPRFLAGESSHIQVLAFLAQRYHRAAGADVHNRLAVERCTDAVLRVEFLRQYREQRGHATSLAAGLLRCGPAARTFLDSGAFDSTHALIDFLIEAAGDTLTYLGCCALFQSPSTQRAESELIAQFDDFARRYPAAAEGFDAVCAHARLDATATGRESLLAQWVREVGTPDTAARLHMLRGAHGAACAYREVFDTLHRLDEVV